jgi:hypothetical protein
VNCQACGGGGSRERSGTGPGARCGRCVPCGHCWCRPRPARVRNTIAHRLRQRRVRVHVPGHVRGLGVPADDQLTLGDHLRHVRADQVHAEHRTAAGLGDDLHHAALAVHHALGHGGQRHRVHLDLAPTRACLRLAQPERGGLRRRVRHPWHGRVVHRGRRQPGQRLGDQQPLRERGVGEPERRRRQQVPDDVDARHGRLQPDPVRRYDEPPRVRRKAGRGQIQALGDRRPADGHQQPLRLHGAHLTPRGAPTRAYAALQHLRVQQPGARPHIDPALLQAARQMPAHLGVLQRNDPVRGLHQGDLGARRPVEGGVLHADRAAVQHQHGRRQARREQGVVAGDHAPPVGREAGERARARASGEHDPATGGEVVHAGRGPRPHAGRGIRRDPLHAHRRRPRQPGAAPGHPHTGVRQMRFDALAVARHDVVPGGHQRRPVDRVQRGLHTPLLARLGDAVDQLGGVQHRLARDAAAGPHEHGPDHPPRPPAPLR